MCSYYNSYLLKKDRSYRSNSDIRLHDGDLEPCLMEEKNIDVHMIFFSFLYSGISDTALGILKMLIRVCFRDLIQPSSLLICSWHYATPSQIVQEMYSIFCSLQVLAMYKKF